MTKFLIRLLPAEKRARYGDELEDLLLTTEHPVRDQFDVLLLVVRLHVEAMLQRFAYRSALGLAVASAFFLFYVVGAVGLIGEEGDRADMMYAGVLGVGIIGAIIARMRPRGMARVLIAMALAQASVAVIALIAGKHENPVTSVYELVGLNVMFIVLFVGSAWLFRHAAQQHADAGSHP